MGILWHLTRPTQTKRIFSSLRHKTSEPMLYFFFPQFPCFQAKCLDTYKEIPFVFLIENIFRVKKSAFAFSFSEFLLTILEQIRKRFVTIDKICSVVKRIFCRDLSNVARSWGECYATTSMRKVELMLEFNSLSVSNFLSRLVLQVISVPFVV